MARQSDHEAQARNHEELIGPLEKLDSHPGWAVTVKFYAAVHWLRAFMAKYGVATGAKDAIHYNHFSSEISAIVRKAEGRVSDDVSEVLDAFQDLRDLSQAARYLCFPRSYFDQKAYEADQNLKRVRDFVETRGVRVK